MQKSELNRTLTIILGKKITEFFSGGTEWDIRKCQELRQGRIRLK